MPTDKDDILNADVPEPDAEPTAAERAHAKAFAELVDKTIAGRVPPALSADDRALLEVATVIRAASGNVELPATKRRTIVEDALRQAVGGVSPATSLSTTPITSARRKWAPWAVATGTSVLAAAAILMLWLRPQHAAPAELPTALRSRSADALIGKIEREAAGDATARIDTIFADRLDGYRALRFGGVK
jgi:hypothetical protein